MPGATLEQCECPPAYNGTSCQTCTDGYYRDFTEYTCEECPCHGHEEHCHQDAIHAEVVCTCNPGWVGQFCETRPIDVRIRGPPVQSVRPGETVKFDCGAKPQIKIEAPMSFQWSREGGALPVGRSQDNGFGLLVLTSVEEDDSGTYVCTVTAGIYSVVEKRELKVEEEPTTTTTTTTTMDPRYLQRYPYQYPNQHQYYQRPTYHSIPAYQLSPQENSQSLYPKKEHRRYEDDRRYPTNEESRRYPSQDRRQHVSDEMCPSIDVRYICSIQVRFKINLNWFMKIDGT